MQPGSNKSPRSVNVGSCRKLKSEANSVEKGGLSHRKLVKRAVPPQDSDNSLLPTIVIIRKILGHIRIQNLTSPANQAFGKTLKTLRTEHGLSQYALAFATGLDRSYISLLERGLRSPTLDTMVSLAGAMNIAISDLVHDVSVVPSQAHQNPSLS